MFLTVPFMLIGQMFPHDDFIDDEPLEDPLADHDLHEEQGDEVYAPFEDAQDDFIMDAEYTPETSVSLILSVLFSLQ